MQLISNYTSPRVKRKLKILLTLKALSVKIIFLCLEDIFQQNI